MLAFTMVFFILLVCICLSIDGLLRLREISINGKSMSKVDAILNLTATSGVVLYSIFSILVGSKGAVDIEMHTNEQLVHMKLLIIGVLQLVQCGLQSLLMNDAFRRQCVKKHQQITKPGQWIIVYLLFANVFLWMYDMFFNNTWLSQPVYRRYSDSFTWSLVSRISALLVIFYRFHSAVLLMYIWRRCYSSHNTKIIVH